MAQIESQPLMPIPSFQVLVDSHYESLFRFGQSLAGNATDAADLTQQTFFIWAKKGHALRDSGQGKILAVHHPISGVPQT